MTSKPLFLAMEEAFDGALDDCFYEWHEVAAAMIRAVARRIGNPEVASWLEEEAMIADNYQSSKDPRNDSDYDTFPYGTEPIPGDTTWAETKAINN
jgi:hypothetical protein